MLYLRTGNGGPGDGGDAGGGEEKNQPSANNTDDAAEDGADNIASCSRHRTDRRRQRFVSTHSARSLNTAATGNSSTYASSDSDDSVSIFSDEFSSDRHRDRQFGRSMAESESKTHEKQRL